ncbi:MAG: 3-phosphoshikimate 1-carboxyvinyltransferase [Bacteroidetes bacterium]|nr:MAG: 3-phosphoshikimate 1-carboxyvinyltransferase [Bacteroidota bacterium]
MHTLTIKPQIINKAIKAAASKSVMQRVIACAVLSEGETVIKNYSLCNDCKAALKIAEDLGAEVVIKENQVSIIPGKSKIKNNINCGESGLGVRMFTPLVSLFGKNFTINGKGSLKKRPVSGIEEALKQAGIKCKTNKGFIPIEISGKLKGSNFEIDGSLSSQILTGLLIALPKAEGNSVIKVINLKSKPYIDLTLSILKDFGIKIINKNYKEFYIKENQKYQAQNYTIEGDWSGAAFFLVAGLIAGEVSLTGLNINSEQADINILEAIQLAEGNLNISENNITTKKSNLKAFQFDATDCPDLFPPLVTMAAFCNGETRIKGVKRLIHKESNRAEVLQKEFANIGIEISIQNDFMTVKGGTVKGGTIHSHNDHRIAMAAAVSALTSEKGITIKNAESIKKSYPTFYSDLLGGNFK